MHMVKSGKSKINLAARIKNMINQEGIQNIIENLNKIYQLEPDTLICMICYQEKDDCVCEKKITSFWPVKHLIRKLKLESNYND